MQRALLARIKGPNAGFTGPLGDRIARLAPTPVGVVVAREGKGWAFRAPLSLDARGRVYTAAEPPDVKDSRTACLLHCFDRSGEPVWTETLNGSARRNQVVVLPEGILHHDQVFAKPGNLTYRSLDGTQIWSTEVSHCHAAVQHPEGGFVLTGPLAGAKVLSPDKGEISGHVAGVGERDTLCRGLFDGERRFVTTRSVYMGPGESSLYELVALEKDGEVAWRFERCFASMWPATIDRSGNVYARYDDGLIAVSKDGELLWEVEFKAYLRGFGATLGPSGAVYWGTKDTVEVRMPDGRRGSLPVPGEVKGPPAFSADGTVIFGADDEEGTLFFASPDLTDHRSITLGAPIESAVALDSRGRLSVGTNDGIVFLR